MKNKDKSMMIYHGPSCASLVCGESVHVVLMLPSGTWLDKTGHVLGAMDETPEGGAYRMIGTWCYITSAEEEQAHAVRVPYSWLAPVNK